MVKLSPLCGALPRLTAHLYSYSHLACCPFPNWLRLRGFEPQGSFGQSVGVYLFRHLSSKARILKSYLVHYNLVLEIVQRDECDVFFAAIRTVPSHHGYPHPVLFIGIRKEFVSAFLTSVPAFRFCNLFFTVGHGSKRRELYTLYISVLHRERFRSYRSKSQSLSLHTKRFPRLFEDIFRCIHVSVMDGFAFRTSPLSNGEWE